MAPAPHPPERPRPGALEEFPQETCPKFRPTLPEEVEHSTEDVDASLVSGSAGVTNLSASNDFSLAQCVTATAGFTYRVEGRLRLDTAALLTATKLCEYFPTTDCTGTPLALDAATTFVLDTAGSWDLMEIVTTAPAGAGSALCSFDLRTVSGASFNAYLDELSLVIESGDLIFEDGFESGDTSAWSAACPGDVTCEE